MNVDLAIERILGDRLGVSPTASALFDAARRWVSAEALLLGRTEADVVVELERSPASWDRFVAAVTITHSYFFRDLHQLEGVFQEIGRVVRARGRARVWSAACAGGEEVWSLAMMAHQAGLDVEILGTDVDPDAIARARVGRFGSGAVRSFPAAMRSWVTVGRDELQVSDALRERVRFDVANLVHPGRVRERFDVILCRNALIYFSPDGRRRAAGTLLAALEDDGTVWVGAAESLRNVVDGLRMEVRDDRVCYARRAREEPASVPAPPARAKTSRDAAAPRPPAGRAAEVGPAIVGLDPRDALRSAIVHRHAGRWDAACDDLRRALFLAPDFWPASWLLAATATHQGDTRTRRRELERTLSLLEDPAAAAAYADLIDDLLPEDVRAACRRGLSRLNQKPGGRVTLT